MARGSIRQRSKSRQDSWTVQVYKGRDPATGKKRYYSESVKGPKALAEKRLTELLRDMDMGSFPERASVSVGAFLDEWLDTECVAVVRPVTLSGYRHVVRRYLKPHLGSMRLDRLRPSHVRKMELSLLAASGPGGRPLRPVTVRTCHRVLSSALSYAVRQRLVVVNVAKSVQAPRLDKRETAVLDWESLGCLLDVIGPAPFRWVVLLALQTGLRRSELGGLQWRDVDFDACTVAVRRGLSRVDNRMVLGLPKSGKARVVVIPDVAVRTLRSIQASAVHVARGDFVFARKDGSFPNIGRWTQVFKVYCRAAGLDDLRFHDLRHSHATLLLADGVHLKIVSERLGHANIGITADLYSHVMPSVQREAVDRFGVSWDAAMGSEDALNCM